VHVIAARRRPPPLTSKQTNIHTYRQTDGQTDRQTDVARTCRFVGLNMSFEVLGNYHTGRTPSPSNAHPDNAGTQVEHVVESLKTQDQESARRPDPNADQAEHVDQAETQL